MGSKCVNEALVCVCSYTVVVLIVCSKFLEPSLLASRDLRIMHSACISHNMYE